MPKKKSLCSSTQSTAQSSSPLLTLAEIPSEEGFALANLILYAASIASYLHAMMNDDHLLQEYRQEAARRLRSWNQARAHYQQVSAERAIACPKMIGSKRTSPLVTCPAVIDSGHHITHPIRKVG